MRFCFRLSGVILLALSLLPACSGKDSAPTESQTLKVGNRSEVQDLDPHLVSGVAEGRCLGSLFEGLCNLDGTTLEPVPGVAESWDIGEDGLRYTFHLRKNAKWSNGEALTAHDFVYAWKRMLSPALASEYAYLLHCLKNGKAYNSGGLADFGQVGAKAVDDHTLEVTLESPTPWLLSMQIHFAWYPVHRATVEKFGKIDTRGSAWTHTGNHVGNGSFKLEYWRPSEVIRCVRNPHYWGAANVKLDALEFYPISDEQTEERSFRTGDLHMTYTVPMHKVEEYRKNSPELLQLAPYFQTYYYRFNVTRKPFDDVRVRRAFGMALNREAMAKDVLKAGEAPAYFFTPPEAAGYTCEYKVAYDPDAARKLLAEAGYPNGAGLPSIDLVYNTSQSDSIISEAVQGMWKKELGADVSLSNQDYKVYLDTMSSLGYGIARSTWAGDLFDPINFIECFLSDSGNNRTGWKNPEFDALVHAAYAEADQGKRYAILQQAEKLLLEEAVITPLCFTTQKYLVAPEVRGLHPNVLGYFRWQDFSLEAKGN